MQITILLVKTLVSNYELLPLIPKNKLGRGGVQGQEEGSS